MKLSRSIGRLAILPALFFLLWSAPLRAVETPIPPPPERWVTDNAAFLSDYARRSLDARLAAHEHATGHQILVWIGKTTGDAPIDDWAVRAFEKWRVGRKGIDDGLVLFVMADDRKLRIEVGYGLEGDVADVIASRIINETIVPRIRSGDRDGAIMAGVEALIGRTGGQAQTGPQAAPNARGSGQRAVPVAMTIGQMIFFGIIGIALLLFVITHPTLAFWLLLNILSNSGRGGRGGGSWGGGGGGGFSGGGGRSGGGGASGSW